MPITSTEPDVLATETRMLGVISLDESGSTCGAPNKQMNSALASEIPYIAKANDAAELGIVRYGGSVQVTEITPVGQLQVPTLHANGGTPMGAAMRESIRILKKRMDELRQAGIGYYKPLIVNITDGEANDAWQEPARELAAFVQDHGIIYVGVAVDGANEEMLRRVSPPAAQIVSLRSCQLRTLFRIISGSMITGQKPDLGELGQEELADLGD